MFGGWLVSEEDAGREGQATYPEDPRRVDDDEVPCELGLVLGDEFPCGALCKRLRGRVDLDGPRARALTCHLRDGRLVPARHVVLAQRRVFLAHRRYRRGEDDPSYPSTVLQSGFQDRRSPQHGGDDELCAAASSTTQIFLVVRRTTRVNYVVVEGRGSVDDRVDTLDSFVKSAVLRDILDDDDLEALAIVCELFFEKCALAQRADGAAHRIPDFEVFLHDPYSEIAVRARDEDFSRGRDSDHWKDW